MNFSWDLLRKLEADYGDSFFYVDVNAFERNFHELAGEFRKIYPNTNIGYSYKTNYLPALCRRVLTMGGYAEVVSRMEYELARRVGVPPDRIIFNGPYKTGGELELALLSGSICNLDSISELDIVERIATAAPEKTINVGLRCNVDIGSDKVSRFGIDVERAEFRRAIDRIRNLEKCVLGGFHFHASSGRRSAESYSVRTERALELCANHFDGTAPRFINLGGGYFSKMDSTLRAQFSDPIPTFEDYAGVIASQVAAAYPGDVTPELIIEPGAALTADVMTLVAKIVGVKEVRSRVVALASGSIHNIKPTLHDKKMPMTIVGKPGETPEPADTAIDIVGYTCMEHDVLFENYSGPVAVGDYALFSNVGAYTIVMKPPFIRPAPPIITYDPDSKKFDVLKRREELDDVFAAYTF